MKIDLTRHQFTLRPEFLREYSTKHPNWDVLGEMVFYRTYSRMKPDGSKEAWWETVQRVVEGVYTFQKAHCMELNLPWYEGKAQNSAQIMYRKIFEFKFTPPGRGLWMMGTKYVYERGGMALNNCGAVSTRDLSGEGSLPFRFVMDGLMHGVGMGFDTEGAHTTKIYRPDRDSSILFTVEDTRESWVESLGKLIESYLEPFMSQVEFDYSRIRPAGDPIRGFGGVASGYEPLEGLHQSIRNLLNQVADRRDSRLSSVDIVDMMNFIGKCVVAGNVRRSAEIALGDIDDEEFFQMKNPDLHALECGSHRWASNNTVQLYTETATRENYGKIVQEAMRRGDPGILWPDNIASFGRTEDGLDNSDEKAILVNPCGEQNLESYELCCLVETYPSNHDNYREYQETLKYAYLYAKTVTLINTHWPETNRVMMKNRRIGTSQSGIIDAFVRHGRREVLRWCDRGYAYLRGLDILYSDWLCIPRSVRITTVKPSGTVSLLAGVSPGIHYPHSEFYERTVQVPGDSKLRYAMEEAGYEVQEIEQEGTGAVAIIFPMHQVYFHKTKERASVWEQVKNVADYQRFWSDNNVSCTVTVRPEEVNEMVDALTAFGSELKSLSLLAYRNDFKYPVYREITEAQYQDRCDRIIGEVNFQAIFANKMAEGESYCSNDSCELPKRSVEDLE